MLRMCYACRRERNMPGGLVADRGRVSGPRFPGDRRATPARPHHRGGRRAGVPDARTSRHPDQRRVGAPRLCAPLAALSLEHFNNYFLRPESHWEARKDAYKQALECHGNAVLLFSRQSGLSHFVCTLSALSARRTSRAIVLARTGSSPTTTGGPAATRKEGCAAESRTVFFFCSLAPHRHPDAGSPRMCS